jgi:acetylornithine deacetylase/succinyl-diaminopimelate desuccinylase-like protein
MAGAHRQHSERCSAPLEVDDKLNRPKEHLQHPQQRRHGAPRRLLGLQHHHGRLGMSVIDDAIALIDRDELVRFALEICNIDSAVGHEGEVGEHLYNWMRLQGFVARKIGLLSNRFNVLGTLPGTGGGYSLIFNSHMDTAVPRSPDLVHADPTDRVYHSAWQEDDLLVGEGICNDKGPMAAFLIAAKAISSSGHRLKGDLLLSAAVTETGGEPCDDPPGTFVESKEIGARFLITHGGVADYALVAEGTGFGLVWVEAGEFWYKLTLHSSQPPFYTPYLPERTTLAASPNMIVAAAAVIEAIEKWAAEYQKRNVYRSPGGTIVPKVQIGGIRSGSANRPILAPQVSHLYIDVRSVPGQDPLITKAELSKVVSNIGLEHTIELYSYRPGFEARTSIASPMPCGARIAPTSARTQDPPRSKRRACGVTSTHSTRSGFRR